MDETFVTLSINKFLNENNYQVIQCIPPGGQGGIHYSLKNKSFFDFNNTINKLFYLY